MRETEQQKLTDIYIHCRSLTGVSLGSVIVNTQQTHADGEASLRLFAPTDQVRP